MSNSAGWMINSTNTNQFDLGLHLLLGMFVRLFKNTVCSRIVNKNSWTE